MVPIIVNVRDATNNYIFSFERFEKGGDTDAFSNLVRTFGALALLVVDEPTSQYTTALRSYKTDMSAPHHLPC